MSFYKVVKSFKASYWGGCLESLYDILTITTYKGEKAVCKNTDYFQAKKKGRQNFIYRNM